MFVMPSPVVERQAPLRRTYAEDPARARTVKWAATSNGDGADVFHSLVHIGKGYGVSQRLGIDHAVGGDHDLPNPGDLLCAALAACEDATVRMVADILGVTILDLRVEVTGDVDVRGCLSTDPSVKVGFGSMECRVHLRVAPGTELRLLAALQKQAESSCVNLDTLRSGLPVKLGFDVAIAT
jgi:uncharacterized OsmC-like protein